MKVVAFIGWSNAGKTTVVEGVVRALRAHGQRVSVIKHAHQDFDIDHPGKDSWRHRQAGAFEVIVASSRRMALMRENEREADPNVHHLIAELWEGVDWVLVEGFKNADLQKIEVWRRPAPGEEARSVRFPDDDFVTALATDVRDAAQLPEPGRATALPLLDVNDPPAVAAWLMQQGERFHYDEDVYWGPLTPHDVPRNELDRLAAARRLDEPAP